MTLLTVLAAANEYAAAFATAPLSRGASTRRAVAPCGVVHSIPPYAADGTELLVCRCGVGPVNAGISLGAALAQRTDINAVLAIGLAGCYDLTCAPLGSVWRVCEEIWPEYGLAGRDTPGADARALGFPLWDDATDGAENMRDAATGATTQTTPAVVWDSLPLPPAPPCAGKGAFNAAAYNALPTARAVTVAGASGSRTCAEGLRVRCEALLENMEGFALALACRRRGVPLYEVRIVSNLAGATQAEYRDFARALQLLSPCLRSLLRGEPHAEAQIPTE